MQPVGLERDLSNIMFISRGHGRGHAVPDMAIAARLTELMPNLRIRFVSYAAGAEAYRACGYDVTDLRLPDMPPLWDQVIALTKLLSTTTPAVIVAHEEMAAVPLASAMNIPCMFITDFFIDPSNLMMHALKYAHEIVFTSERGVYTEPPYLADKVHYVGRTVRKFQYGIADRERARHELDIPADALVVLCQPGAWGESRVPLWDLLSAAWDRVPASSKRLIWLAGRDYHQLLGVSRGRTDVIVLKEDWNIDRLMAASNVLISKANRVTVYEAAAIGLPSISISNSANWPDDVAVAKVDSNSVVWRDSVTPQELADLILKKSNTAPVPATEISSGVDGSASRIKHMIESLRRRESYELTGSLAS